MRLRDLQRMLSGGVAYRGLGGADTPSHQTFERPNPADRLALYRVKAAEEKVREAKAADRAVARQERAAQRRHEAWRKKYGR